MKSKAHWLASALPISTMGITMEKATELEFLTWFFVNADFGPADSDVRIALQEEFTAKTGKAIPDGYSVEE